MNYQGYYPNYSYVPQNAPQAPQPQFNADDRLFVSGEQEAASWVVLRGQSARLWDRNGQTFYVKTISESGQPLPLEIYDYKRRDSAPPTGPSTAFNPDDYVKREEFDDFKKQFSRRKKKEEVIIDADAE